MNNNISNGDETIRRMGGKRHLLKDRQKQYNLSQKNGLCYASFAILSTCDLFSGNKTMHKPKFCRQKEAYTPHDLAVCLC